MKKKYIYVTNILYLNLVIFLTAMLLSSCDTKSNESSLPAFDKSKFLKKPQENPVVSETVLWCRYRDEYGRTFGKIGMNEKNQKFVFSKKTNLFWECPEPLFPTVYSQSCPQYINSNKKIYSDIFLMVNETPVNVVDSQNLNESLEVITPQEFEFNAFESCQNYTEHNNLIFFEYGVKSPNDIQPYLFHRPFFSTSTQTVNKDLPFHQIVVFGDSFSNGGSFWDQSQHKILQWPYFMGRFSNGPIWIEQATSKINKLQKNNPTIHLYNFSVGSKESEKFDLTYDINDLDKQVDRYLNSMHESLITSKNWNIGFDKTLYIIFMGMDDYFMLSDPNNKKGLSICENDLSFQDPLAPNVCANTIVNGSSNGIRQKTRGIKGNIRKIILASGKDTKEMFFLVPALPNVTLLPYYNFSHIPPLAPIISIAFVNLAYKRHNDYLENAIYELKKEFKNKKLNFINLNMDEIFTKLISQDAGQYAEIGKKAGIINKSSECFKGDVSDLKPSLDFCADPKTYLFWDKMHPTMTTHCILSELTIQKIYETFRLKEYVPNFTECQNSFIVHPIQKTKS